MRSASWFKHSPVRKGVLQRAVGQVYAIDGISFDIAEGESLGLAGQSGPARRPRTRRSSSLIHPTGGGVAFTVNSHDRGRSREAARLLPGRFPPSWPA